MTARSSTQDRHAAINAARAQRDAARERLYALQLRRVELERAMEREKRGQRALDPDFARALAALRASESTIIAGLRSLAERLEELEDLPRRVDHARARVDDLTRHAAGLSDEIVALGERLAQRPPAKRRREKISPEVDPEILALRKAQSERAITTRDADTARKQLGALVKRAAAEDEAIVAIREEVTASEAGLREVRTQIREVEGEAGRTKVSDTAKRNAKAVAEARAEVAEFEANVRIAVATLVDGRQPQELIAEWDDALPILLLPLRLETRWNVAAEPPELWVRVYPDDVAVATHEKILTDMEDKHGRAYWTARRQRRQTRTVRRPGGHSPHGSARIEPPGSRGKRSR